MQELPCGHFMHSHCFEQYTRYNYTCPVCTKSLGDMKVYFRMIDSLMQHGSPAACRLCTRPARRQASAISYFAIRHAVQSCCCLLHRGDMVAELQIVA